MSFYQYKAQINTPTNISSGQGLSFQILSQKTFSIAKLKKTFALLKNGTHRTSHRHFGSLKGTTCYVTEGNNKQKIKTGRSNFLCKLLKTRIFVLITQNLISLTEAYTTAVINIIVEKPLKLSLRRGMACANTFNILRVIKCFLTRKRKFLRKRSKI